MFDKKGLLFGLPAVLILLVIVLVLVFGPFNTGQFAIVSVKEEQAFGQTWTVVQSNVRSSCGEQTARFSVSDINLGVGSGSDCSGPGISATTDLGERVETVLVSFSGSVKANRDGIAILDIGTVRLSVVGSGFGDAILFKSDTGTLSFVKKSDGTWNVFQNGVLIKTGVSRLSSVQADGNDNRFEIGAFTGVKSPQGTSEVSVQITGFDVIRPEPEPPDVELPSEPPVGPSDDETSPPVERVSLLQRIIDAFTNFFKNFFAGL